MGCRARAWELFLRNLTRGQKGRIHRLIFGDFFRVAFFTVVFPEFLRSFSPQTAPPAVHRGPPLLSPVRPHPIPKTDTVAVMAAAAEVQPKLLHLSHVTRASQDETMRERASEGRAGTRAQAARRWGGMKERCTARSQPDEPERALVLEWKH